MTLDGQTTMRPSVASVKKHAKMPSEKLSGRRRCVGRKQLRLPSKQHGLTRRGTWRQVVPKTLLAAMLAQQLRQWQRHQGRRPTCAVAGVPILVLRPAVSDRWHLHCW
jgi:hypothetical protein